MFLIAIAACLLAAELTSKSPEERRMEVWKTLEDQQIEAWRTKEDELRKKLAEKSIWTDPKQRETLLSYLALARSIRSQSSPTEEAKIRRGKERVSAIRASHNPSLVELLLSHLTYSPKPPKIDSAKKPDLDKEYPVAGTLVALGSVAVPELLDVLKNADPAGRTGAKKRELALFCLIAIYGEGGYGPQMARERIELELKNTSAKERGFLGKALESPLLQKADRK